MAGPGFGTESPRSGASVRQNRIVQVGDGSRNLQDAIVSAGGKAQSRNRIFEYLLPVRAYSAVLIFGAICAFE